MANPSPGLKAHPEHTVMLQREGGHVTVRFNGVALAETRNAITLREKGYPPVLYIPRSDIQMQYLLPTDRTSHCPFKGEARYWTMSAAGKIEENAVWAYDRPYDEVIDLAGHAAFYADKVEIAVS